MRSAAPRAPLAAAFANNDPFTAVDPDGVERIVSLGATPTCFRGPIGVANRRRPLRHLIGLSQEMIGNAKQDRLFLIGQEPMFVWSSLVLHFGLPALPEWSGWFLSELKRRKRIQTLAGFGYQAVAVKTRRQELLKLIEQGVRQKKLSFPTTNGPVHWPESANLVDVLGQKYSQLIATQ